MPAIASKLKLKLRPEDTEERCGLVTSKGRLIDVPNAHPNPAIGFAIPVKEIIKRKSVVGTFHTHPGKSAALSQDDYLGFSNWPDLVHYIVGTDGVRAYRADEDGIIEELPCT